VGFPPSQPKGVYNVKTFYEETHNGDCIIFDFNEDEALRVVFIYPARWMEPKLQGLLTRGLISKVIDAVCGDNPRNPEKASQSARRVCEEFAEGKM